MALEIVVDDSIGPGTRITLGAGDDLFVAEGATVSTADSSITIICASGGHSVDIQGAVHAKDSLALAMGSNGSESGQHLTIGAHGFIGNDNYTTGVPAAGVLGNNSIVDNQGTIDSALFGLAVGGVDPTATTIVNNSGLIHGGLFAVYKAGDTFDTLVLTNTGEIRADGRPNAAAYDSSFENSVDHVINHGLMVGRIDLGKGDDLYDGRGGGELRGQASGDMGSDKMFGGAFADVFKGGDGIDTLDGGGGDDSLDGGTDSDLIAGGAGKDTLIGDDGNDTLDGGTGNDLLTGDDGQDSLTGGAGNDSLHGGSDNDTLSGGDGNDHLTGGAGADLMRGGAGSDLYVVDSSLDKVDEAGGSGIDAVLSAISFNLGNPAGVHGRVENLALENLATAITATGNSLDNTLTGNDFGNTLAGGAGKDALDGGKGGDTLIGGIGVDVLTGGKGNDVFVFNEPLSAQNRDIVTDFANAAGDNDTFRLAHSIFTALGGAGHLKAGFFHVGTAAHDANDHIIYNRATGALSYDSNGDADGGSVLIATLTNKPLLSAHDFAVI